MAFLGVEARNVCAALAEGLCDLGGGGITSVEGLCDVEASRAPTFLYDTVGSP
jgi:hypothetical protein